jgi:hypothetical protein
MSATMGSVALPHSPRRCVPHRERDTSSSRSVSDLVAAEGAQAAPLHRAEADRAMRRAAGETPVPAGRTRVLGRTSDECDCSCLPSKGRVEAQCRGFPGDRHVRCCIGLRGLAKLLPCFWFQAYCRIPGVSVLTWTFDSPSFRTFGPVVVARQRQSLPLVAAKLVVIARSPCGAASWSDHFRVRRLRSGRHCAPTFHRHAVQRVVRARSPQP